MLASRAAAAATLAAGIGLVAAGLAHVPVWTCPIRAATGVPCPGCGLTTATLALLHGHWAEAAHVHAFAYLVPPVLVLLLLSATLPDRPRRGLLAAVAFAERRGGAGVLALGGLLLYWLARFW